MSDIKVLYIDDRPDDTISEVLLDKYGQDSYLQYTFNCQQGYESLLESEDVQKSNIIIIDSRLFENNKVDGVKFTGEEFKIMLKKLFPFVEVIVITQNIDSNVEYIVPKYKKTLGLKAYDFYCTNLIPKIEEAKKKVEMYRNLMKKLEGNNNINKVLIEKIQNSLNGINMYDEMCSDDITKLIATFKELEAKIDE